MPPSLTKMTCPVKLIDGTTVGPRELSSYDRNRWYFVSGGYRYDVLVPNEGESIGTIMGEVIIPGYRLTEPKP